MTISSKGNEASEYDMKFQRSKEVSSDYTFGNVNSHSDALENPSKRVQLKNHTTNTSPLKAYHLVKIKQHGMRSASTDY